MSNPVGGRPDELGMWPATLALPDQLVAGASRAEADLGGWRPPSRVAGPVLVVGMGGSGMAGDVAAVIASERAPVPLLTWKTVGLPRWCGPSTLVVAISCSGTTAETLSSAQVAAERGATVVTISGGGTLEALASADGAAIGLPEGIPMPRAGLGAMVGALLVALGRAGVLDDVANDVQEAAQHLLGRRDQMRNELAPSVAAAIAGTVPIIHGDHPLGATAALRWKNQVNENAKLPAFFGAEPEVGHNEATGFEALRPGSGQALSLVTLSWPGEDPWVAERARVAAELARPRLAAAVSVRGEGTRPLAALLDLVLLGDLVSLELAAAAGIDPGPIPVLGELKRKMAERGASSSTPGRAVPGAEPGRGVDSRSE